MMAPGPLEDDEDPEAFDPLACGAASPPPVLGGGCMARFDPQHLNDESGADYSGEGDAD